MKQLKARVGDTCLWRLRLLFEREQGVIVVVFNASFLSSGSTEKVASSRCFLCALAVAALVCGLAFVVGFVLLLGPLSLYVKNSLDADFALRFLQQHSTWLYLWNFTIYVVFGIALVFFCIALYLQSGCRHSMLPMVMLCFGCIWATHAIAAGMLANVGLARVLALAEIDASIAASVWLNNYTIKLGLGGSNEIIGGLWLVVASLSGRSKGVLGARLGGYGVLVGVCGCSTVIPVWQEMGAVFGLGVIGWFFCLSALAAQRVANDSDEPPHSAGAA
ncbi:MAG: hypothetical protein ACPGSC_03835 [Granulosicoccaceae bacterium]